MITTLEEIPRPEQSIPLFELPGWRDRYGVVAGVTGRGPADQPFDLGLAGDQPIGRVLDRWRKLQSAFPEFPGTVVARQVHGTTVLWHGLTRGWLVVEGADGHATDAAGLLLTVSLADCVPIYLLDPIQRAIALLHSGWRGTAGGVVLAGIKALVEHAKSSVDNIVVHCGVSICGDCYEVGPEVAEACRRPAGGPSVGLDLRAIIADTAARAGIQRITVSPHCSAHHSTRFFSHRASRGQDGRMVAFLGLVPDN